MKIYLILHNIRSVFNVGSIFRTADAMGARKIFLTGYTPDPAEKTSLGAEKFVESERFKSPLSLVKKLKSEKFFIASLEQTKGSISLKKFSEKKYKKLVLILGNEVKGVSKNLLDASDCAVEIPMRGKKESLNVSVTAGIALYAISQ